MAEAAKKVTDTVKNGVDNIKIEDGTTPLAPKSIATKKSKEPKVSKVGALKIEER